MARGYVRVARRRSPRGWELMRSNPPIAQLVALCLAGGAIIAATAVQRVKFPTPTELHEAFVPATQVPGGALSAPATLQLWLASSARWRFPSDLYRTRFGYLTAAEAVRPVPGGAEGVQGTPAWEVAFGGLSLCAPNLSRNACILWHDDTVFLDAETGAQLYEVWNDCAPCAKRQIGSHA